MRTARLVPTPWLCRNSLISRISLAPCHAWAIRLHQMQFGRAVFDYGKNVGTEAPHQFLGENRADPLHEPAAQIPLDSLGGGRRHGLQGRGFELKAVFLVPHPPAFGHSPAVTQPRL